MGSAQNTDHIRGFWQAKAGIVFEQFTSSQVEADGELVTWKWIKKKDKEYNLSSFHAMWKYNGPILAFEQSCLKKYLNTVLFLPLGDIVRGLTILPSREDGAPCDVTRSDCST